MILVAGLAIAGLAGIAAAFYFSVRPGTAPHQRSSRVRVTGTGRTRADWPPADRSRSSAVPSRNGRAAARPRPDPDDDFGGPSRYDPDSEYLAAGRGVRGGSSGPRADQEALAGPRAAAGAGSQPGRAAQPDWESDTTAEEAKGTRSRLRVGWRKGSEVDEELWPSEAFGGVSDEQFWDDLASDKPLATTARTANAAQPDPASRRRLPDAVPGPDGRGGAGRGRGDNGRIAGGGSGAYPQPATRPGPADRTAIQPIQAGPQPIHTGPQPIQVGPQPIQAGTTPPRSYQSATAPQPYQAAAPSYQAATQPAPIAGQGDRRGLPADPRGRARSANGTDLGLGAAAGEDPLTSAAYSLRPRGAVDGRSYQSPRRSREQSREQYDGAPSQETQSFSLADAQAATGGYPGGVPPFRQFELPPGGGNGRAPEPRPDAVRSDTARYDRPGYDPLRTDSLRSDAYWSGGRPDPLRGQDTADAYAGTGGYPYPERPYSDPVTSASAPPYGDTYGYGYPVSPVDDPRQPSSTRGPGRSGGHRTGSRDPRQPYPAGNGYRGVYDPRANGRG